MTLKRYESQDTIPIPHEVMAKFMDSTRPTQVHEEGNTLPICPRCDGEGRLTELTEIDGGYRATSERYCSLCHGDGFVSLDVAESWTKAHADSH